MYFLTASLLMCIEWCMMCVGLVRERSVSVAAMSSGVTSTMRRRRLSPSMKMVDCIPETLDSWIRTVRGRKGRECWSTACGTAPDGCLVVELYALKHTDIYVLYVHALAIGLGWSFQTSFLEYFGTTGYEVDCCFLLNPYAFSRQFWVHSVQEHCPFYFCHLYSPRTINFRVFQSISNVTLNAITNIHNGPNLHIHVCYSQTERRGRNKMLRT